MEYEVDKVVTQGVGFAEPVIPTKGEDGKGPIAFVTLFFAHWSTPEKKITKGFHKQQDKIFLIISNIIIISYQKSLEKRFFRGT